MIAGYSPEIQAIFGTLFTWGLTAAGSALVFFMRGTQRKFLDSSLGFAAGVMLAASYWSLLAPAIEMAESSGMYGESGEYAFAPVALGFFMGALFVFAADQLMHYFKIGSTELMMETKRKQIKNSSGPEILSKSSKDGLIKRKAHLPTGDEEELSLGLSHEDYSKLHKQSAEKWKRILLLVIAITVHNIPEGLAVGVGFGAIGKSPKATFESARNLAVGIGIQNFPEGLAVSLPLRGAGVSVWKSFWYGQLSGMVEPIAGLIGVLCVSWIEPLLPYAMAFAAGAMVYVVCDDLIPEASSSGNGRQASWGAIFGFILMMCLDVGLG
ncbi:zinc transporter ZIP11-like isoform X2 [Daphnia pulicaria]|uniref:zinc transporter ZIP11-like isoform X2 n=1 Tax=Daphnia pulicaria TaxID=35523 RepID=UPI001EE9B82E|nr:zinc transporter ZIP11-like isoform X2 [Daphnia pulicaria]